MVSIDAAGAALGATTMEMVMAIAGQTAALALSLALALLLEWLCLRGLFRLLAKQF